MAHDAENQASTTSTREPRKGLTMTEVNESLKEVYGQSRDPLDRRTVDYYELRLQLNDFESTFYGPYACPGCGIEIVSKAREQGGAEFTRRPAEQVNGRYTYVGHDCFIFTREELNRLIWRAEHGAERIKGNVLLERVFHSIADDLRLLAFAWHEGSPAGTAPSPSRHMKISAR